MEPLMSKLSAREEAFLARFPSLPDEAAVSLAQASLINGISPHSWRRNPPIPVFFISGGLLGVYVGMLRKLTRGELAPAA
jgi:hypothetical protein